MKLRPNFRLGTRKSLDITGRKFGRLTVLRFVETRKKHRYWECSCECGGTAIVSLDTIGKRVFSCGCYHLQRIKESNSTHGLSATIEYHTWERMKNRCYNIRAADYADYGGRGIEVCTRWRNNFVAFLLDMGKRPTRRHSIDRRNNNGNYDPDNCRWATPKEQANNRREARR